MHCLKDKYGELYIDLTLPIRKYTQIMAWQPHNNSGPCVFLFPLTIGGTDKTIRVRSLDIDHMHLWMVMWGCYAI
jgi:hypothetical protein